jgi:hypothetical protein
VIKIFSPYVVVTNSLKTTETVVAAVQVVEAVVVLVLVAVEVVAVRLVDTVLELELDPGPEAEIAISAQ